MQKHVFAWILLATAGAAFAQTIPSDPAVGCSASVSAPIVNSWFKSGTASVNGVVDPANSVTFPDTPNCSFYAWAYQMFLWLTSPAPPIYGGGGGRIFRSSAFFDVSPLDSNGQRTMTAPTTALTNLSVLSTQLGPNKLQLVVDKNGRVFEAAPPDRRAVPRVRNSSGQLVTIARAQVENGNLVLSNSAGARIQPRILPLAASDNRALPRPAPPNIPSSKAPLTRIRKFVVDGRSIFIDLAGNLIETEQGQADGSVLIAQNGSPIYYAIAVNEVLAYFRTQQGPSVPKGLLFPTTEGELNNITNFATANGRTFVDPEALTVEIKTAWIEAAGISNPADYITISGAIPTYDKSNPQKWVKNGTKTATLALVAIHVVGSTAGHPEMVWATFEHLGNTANDDYSYRNSMGGVTAVPRNTSGSWLFTATDSSGPFSQTRQILTSSGDIEALSGTVGPDNVIRFKAWGAASNVGPNPLADTPTSNAQVISINNGVRSLLGAGDVRRNYYMTGAAWLTTFPLGPIIRITIEVGTSMLSNTTIETFTQGSDTTSGGLSCFSCHPKVRHTDVSHIFDSLKPLF